MPTSDPRDWHPERAGRRDPQLAAQFASLVIGADGVPSDEQPAPGSRLERANRVCDAQEAGELTDVEAYLKIRDLIREAIAEAEADEDAG